MIGHRGVLAVQHVVMERNIAQGDVMRCLESMEHLKNVKLAKELLNENLQSIYNFQDNVRFSWHESQRNINRLLVQIDSAYFHLERLQGRFEQKIKTSEDSNFIARMRSKRIQLFSNTFDDLLKESGKLR